MKEDLNKAVAVLKNNPSDEQLIEILATYNEKEKQEIMKQLSDEELEEISDRMDDLLKVILGVEDHVTIGLEVNLEDLEYVKMSSKDKISCLEEYNQVELIDKLVWSNEKIKCLQCYKGKYSEQDSYWEDGLKYYVFMCDKCGDIIQIGVDKRNNSIQDIRVQAQ